MSNNHNIYIGNNSYSILDKYLYNYTSNFSKVFILVDKNSEEFCLPLLFKYLPNLKYCNIIKIKPGENQKNIFNCIKIWKYLSEKKADRESLLINLGGGVITDIGGFVASTFKRGIKFINIPTTLLGMSDASIGGKTGIDLENIKNEIGLFKFPEFIIIDINYLETLCKKEIKSGMAEIIKHGLIYDLIFWKKINEKNLTKISTIELEELIKRSVFIKDSIIKSDPNEIGIRKILNFGHTIGHAIESYFIIKKKKLLSHGESIALGMLCESWISYKTNGLSKNNYQEIMSFLKKYYSMIEINKCDLNKIINIMKYDKKNKKNKINFSLLKSIGNCSYNYNVKDKLIKESFKQILKKSKDQI